ncbi:MAG: SRPBCC family protein [Elusimicrobiota bacterium]
MSRTRDLRFSLSIRAKPDDVYRALTSATQLCRWWLAGAETDARNAGRFRMVWPKIRVQGARGLFPPHAARGESEGVFVDLEPGRKVAWLWKQARKPTAIPPLASFFIEKSGRTCAITLLHSGFSKSRSSDKIYAGCAAGWEDCLAKLKLYLEAGKTCRARALTFEDAGRLLRETK